MNFLNEYDTMTSILFTPYKIGNLVIKNRVVRSATYLESASKAGEITDRIISVHENLAKNQIGLIITGYMYVSENGHCSPLQLGIHNDSLIPGLKKLVAAVKQYEDVIIFPQIVHGGRQNYIMGEDVVAPSPIPDKFINVMPREMTLEDIQICVKNFIDASRRAYEAGFDGVQLHIAHGYLLSEFISPYCNRRTDLYGGSLENRFRIIREIILGVQDALGREFPIIVKLNVTDFVRDDPQLTVEDCKIYAKWMVDLGVAAVETSGGLMESILYGDYTGSRMGIDTIEDEAYFLNETKTIKQEIGDVPVILTGGLKSIEVIEKVIKEGIDFVGFCRPLVREPDLISKWISGSRKKADCKSCNKCLILASDRKGVRCMRLEKKERILRRKKARS